MKCVGCQHENNPGAKFCEERAAPLARVCANWWSPAFGNRQVLLGVRPSRRPGGALSPTALRRSGSLHSQTPRRTHFHVEGRA